MLWITTEEDMCFFGPQVFFGQKSTQIGTTWYLKRPNFDHRFWSTLKKVSPSSQVIHIPLLSEATQLAMSLKYNSSKVVS